MRYNSSIDSPVAQWWSKKLLTSRLSVRAWPGEPIWILEQFIKLINGPNRDGRTVFYWSLRSESKKFKDLLAYREFHAQKSTKPQKILLRTNWYNFVSRRYCIYIKSFPFSVDTINKRSSNHSPVFSYHFNTVKRYSICS